MSRTVTLLYWLVGHGFILLFSVCWGNVIPGPNVTTEFSPENFTSEASSSGKSTELIDLIINSSAETGNSSALIFKNTTETSVTIIERTGKSVDFSSKIAKLEEAAPGNQDDNSTSSPIATSTEKKDVKEEKNAPSELTAKLATAEDHSPQRVGEEEDAPPKPTLPIPAKTTTTRRTMPKVRRIDLVEPRFLYVETTKPPANAKDRLIQDIFGGQCTHEIWNQCNRITYWGGDYLIPDKKNPGKMILKHHKIRCVESPDSTICLKNGWTVARCHMLCMSQCNVEYRINYDDLVLHDGACRFPLLIRK